MAVTSANVGSVIAGAIPELRADIEEDEGLVHLIFMELFCWTESAAQGEKSDEVSKAIRLVDSIFRDCDADVKNALTVSFLENVDPENSVGQRIFDALTPELRSQWHELDGYMAQQVGKSLRGRVTKKANSEKS